MSVDPGDLVHLASGTYRHVCPPAKPGEARCTGLVKTDDAGKPLALASPADIQWWDIQGFWGAADLASAYSIPTYFGSNATVAIILGAFDDPDAESDLADYRAAYGLPPCASATGCFRKISPTGSTTALPPVNTSASQETSIDLDMASAGCPSCNLILVEADDMTSANLGIAIDKAVALGATAVSMSFALPEFSGETSFDSHFNRPGVGFFASSGDSGFFKPFANAYPAVSPFVTAVGGTVLNETALEGSAAPRGWTETAWSGSGSGCSEFEAKPSFQFDTLCARRTIADVSAVAENVLIRDSYAAGPPSAGWALAGGTSASTPLVAAIYALTGRAAAGPAFSYTATVGVFNDVTSGSNGSCSGSALCTAGPNYDAPTGQGTPNGAAFAGLSDVWRPADAYLAVPSGGSATVEFTLNLLRYPPNYTFSLSFVGLPAGVTATWTGGYAGSTEAGVTFTAASTIDLVERTITVVNTLPDGETFAANVEIKIAPCLPAGSSLCVAGGQCGGVIPDGCGGEITCSLYACASGDVCSANHCCPAGTTWELNDCVSSTVPRCPAGEHYCGPGQGCTKYVCK